MSKRVLWIPISVIVLGAAFLAAMSYELDRWAARPLPIDREVDLMVRPGMTFTAVVDLLDERGVVAPLRFSLLAMQRGLQKAVQSGEYRVPPGETADALLRRLTTGDVVVHRLRIAEGGTVNALLRQLRADRRTRFNLRDANVLNLLERLELPAGHAEGWFFPDTYQFRRGQTASALLRRAYFRMEEQLALAWKQRDPSVTYANAYEALILASIVEKETAHAADRARIAGVFARRLRERMRLQSDVTVIYGLGDVFDGDLKRTHLDADGAYNTYQRHGLPPTPIALPSLASIEATLHPQQDDALYFVSRGDGTSEFSRTLAEHNAAVRRYQLR